MSPSAAKRWMACPGSVRLLAALPPSLPSVHAGEGTAAHALAERCLRENSAAAAHLGEEINGYPVTDEMAAAVQVYLDEVQQLAFELDISHGLKGIDVEKRLDLTWFRPGMYGTADALLDARTPDKLRGMLVVFDYKHGRGVEVEAEGNPQLQCYGLGALGPEPAGGCTPEAVTVRVVIVQPRCGDGAIREAIYSSQALREWGRDVLGPAADATAKPDAPLVPGEDQCRWCDAKATCPALRKMLEGEVQVDFGGPNIPAVIAPNVTAVPVESPDGLTGKVLAVPTDELARILAALPLLESWAEAVRQQAEARALDGEKIPGFKLVESRTNRRWARDESDTAVELCRLAIDPWAPAKLIGIPEAEKLCPKDKRDALRALILKPAGVPTLVPESDKRGPWLTAEQEFVDHDRAALEKHGPQGGDPMGGPLVVVENAKPKRKSKPKAAPVVPTDDLLG